MYAMILKMSSITALYVLLTVLIWKRTLGRALTSGRRILIGLVYGICSILSTHFAVDYSQMLLNVRDLGPLIAGSFFSPVSGIIAGLIGGVERYIAGTYWGIGSYTRIACSVSTCLAGFIAAAIHIFIFKRKKPSAVYAFFMGAVMEVFHMYVVLITHRNDMSMAFYVVRVCALPMISFTGLGMAVCSVVLKICTGEWENPFRRVSTEEVPVSRRFQFWLFAVTFSILALNLLFSFAVQTQTAEQAGQDTISSVSEDIRQAYHRLRQTETGTKVLTEETVMTAVQAIAETVESSGGAAAADASVLERMMHIFDLEAVAALNADGQTVASAGRSELLDGIWNGIPETALIASDSLTAAAAPCGDGMVLAAISRNRVASALNFPGLHDALSYYHVGSEGTFDIFGADGAIAAGNHMGGSLSAGDLEKVTAQPAGVCFHARLFDSDSLCRTEQLGDGMTLLVRLPMTAVYASRDAQTYETAFADIILFAVVYVLVSMLVQGIVVNNLELVQASLDRIADGNMDEVVSVRSSSEFTSLSDNINQTVSVLKGYIDAAEKRIEEELEFARIIQDSSLPKNFHFPRNEFSVYAMMDPAREVGGDFYDFFGYRGRIRQGHSGSAVHDAGQDSDPRAG